jgi:hypothetical protein
VHITSRLTIISFSFSILSTGPTDGHTGGDKHPKKTTGTTETTDGQTGSDKNPNKATGTTGLLLGCLSPPA